MPASGAKASRSSPPANRPSPRRRPDRSGESTTSGRTNDPLGEEHAIPSRSLILRILLAEKVVQHLFVTAAFATDLAQFRDDAPFDYRWFLISGGIVALLFALALYGHLQHHRWSLQLAITLAVFDIVGEFVYQGGLNIVITVSLLVATVALVLASIELRRTATEPASRVL